MAGRIPARSISGGLPVVMEGCRPRVPPAAWLIGALLVMLALAMAGAPGRAEARAQLPQCSDNIDNDGDNTVDFPFDSGCNSLSDAVESNPGGTRACADGNDNDGDGITDFPKEPGCESANDNSEGNPANVRNRPACADNADNDQDGRIDFLQFGAFPYDPGCSWASETSEADTACSDGIDNDGDGRIDFPADLGCGANGSTPAVNDNDETDPPQCNDGRDNDADGKIDYEQDPDCAGSAGGASEGIPAGPRPACSDGVDNDGDGKVDLADPGCSSSSDGDETNTLVVYNLPAGDLTSPGRTSSSSPRLLSPFPIVRLRGRTTRRGVRVTLLTVTAPLRSKVSVYCKGKSCPRRRVSVTAMKRLVRMRRFERRLRGGTELRIYVTRPGYIGKYTRFRFKSNHVPQRMDRCATTAGTRPRICPTS